MRSCASIVLVFLGSVCSTVAVGEGRPLSSFDELLSMAVLITSWWMLLMADLTPTGHLAVCGRADCRDVVVDDMLWRIAGKSVRYAGELVVPEPLSGVRRHQPSYDISGNSQR